MHTMVHDPMHMVQAENSQQNSRIRNVANLLFWITGYICTLRRVVMGVLPGWMVGFWTAPVCLWGHAAPGIWPRCSALRNGLGPLQPSPGTPGAFNLGANSIGPSDFTHTIFFSLLQSFDIFSFRKNMIRVTDKIGFAAPWTTLSILLWQQFILSYIHFTCSLHGMLNLALASLHIAGYLPMITIPNHDRLSGRSTSATHSRTGVRFFHLSIRQILVR